MARSGGTGGRLQGTVGDSWGLEYHVSLRILCGPGALYSHTELPDLALGARTVNVQEGYNTDGFRPRLSGMMSNPVFI